ncbi:MAG: GHMP kinase [Flavobacteriales bacterium]|nr:GHMP kinase [Flavobacteriales bacterium]
MERTFLKRNSIDTQHFSSCGKLMLTGEYLVLNGAKALALKTKYRQTLSIKTSKHENFSWTALSHNKEPWLQFKFEISNAEIRILTSSDPEKTVRLIEILKLIYAQRPILFTQPLAFETKMDFEKNWGLGTSSTLISNLATWSGLNAFDLLEKSFGGSGYDVAVAQEDHSILYQLNSLEREVSKVVFDPPFASQLFFVFLNRKQNSQEAISSYSGLLVGADLPLYTEKVSRMTEEVLHAITLEKFEELMFEHETIISKILGRNTVKKNLFSDYTGGICKSLGAWGGDFILVTGKPENLSYFRERGFDTIIPFKDMIDAN